MFANSLARGARRRGIVLVLILGMLGLLALIGVTFATFAGQSLINARNFSQSENREGAEQYFDFALGQLINDTNNPLSAIRGHSLLRDMYGNDSVQRGTTASEIGGYLDHVLDNNGNSFNLQFSDFRVYQSNANSPYNVNGLNLIQFKTNIPTSQISYQYNGLNFTRWILRIQSPLPSTTAGLTSYPTAAQTFEVLEDDDRGTDLPFSGGYHLLTLSVPDAFMTVLQQKTADPNRYYKPPTGTYANATVDTTVTPYAPAPGTPVGLAPTYLLDNNGNKAFPNPFVLDGRYMRAFNGPGMNRSLMAAAQAATTATGNNSFFPLVPFNVAAYANFRVNGKLTDPTFPANFAAGNVVFPSNIAYPVTATSTAFGDPDVIGMDEDYDACDLENWFLAIQSADGQVVVPSFHRPGILTAADWTSAANTQNGVAGLAKILRPRAVDQGPQFGSSAPDPTPDPLNGRINYDLDNDGDGVTDSVWLDLGYPVQRDAGGKLFKPLFAFMVIGQNGRLPLNTVGNIQSRDYQTIKSYGVDTSGNAVYSYGPQTFYDAPTWDHTSHLGYSVNEINPKYALQNAPANVYSTNVTTTNPAVVGDSNWSQIDNAGINVAVTQLRNLLAGTVPMDNPTIPTNTAQEYNYVKVNGASYYMPNGVIDQYDNGYNSDPTKLLLVRQAVPPVPGRFGEAEGIPNAFRLYNGSGNGYSIFASSLFPTTPSIYFNPVRAGRSIFSAMGLFPSNSFQATAGAMDDDFDSFDPQFTSAIAEYTLPYRDAIGQWTIASERAQRFLTPTDPSGTGRLVEFMNRPDDSSDFGRGFDKVGRVGFFRYFRPPGLPRDVSYPIPAVPDTGQNIAGYLDSYRMAVFNYHAALGTPMIPNRSNNLYHGYEGFRAPITNTSPFSGVDEATKIAVMGAMPYDSYSMGTFTGVPVVGNTSATPTPNLGSTNGFTGPTGSSTIDSESGPYLFGTYNPATPTGALVPYYPYLDQAPAPNAQNALVVNGYPMGSLNKDEADEMNLYSPNRDDMQFGPSDLEWLYRKQDVDGSTLNSRLSKLAPVSFLNPKDGTMRRRFFSVDSWEPNSFVYANDNPQGAFQWNSRFGQLASASLALTNQVVANPNASPTATADPQFFANDFAVEGLPNPTLPVPIFNYTPYPNSPNAGTVLPLAITGSPTATNTTNLFANGFANSSPATQLNGGVHSDLFARPNPLANSLASPTMTPSLAHRDRRINLNYPLPVASDPAEPIRQKWIRETYQLLKATLPPQSVDTPQELAALSQYVINIIDFRDPDSTMTRFVNTDLMVVPADLTANTPSNVKFADRVVPQYTDPAPFWDPNTSKTAISFGAPFDPNIALEQTNPSGIGAGSWDALMGNNAFVVQYGMEYNPIAINEVLCYTGNGNGNGTNTPFSRFYVELVNTLTDDSSHGAGTGSEDLSLSGWDFVIMEDNVLGRPDPITGSLTPNIGGIAAPAPAVVYPPATPVVPAPGNMPSGTGSLPAPANSPPNTPGGAFPGTAIGWSLGTGGLDRDFTNPTFVAARIAPIQANSGSPNVKYYVMANPVPASGGTTLDPIPIYNGPDSTMPASFLPSLTPPTSGATNGKFYWLYLRRPANQFNHSTEMVVVDAMRFNWSADNGTGMVVANYPQTTTPGNPNQTSSTTQIFSAQRPQPFRGGHLVTAPFPNPPFAYGYSEQTIGDNTSQSNVTSGGANPTNYTSGVWWMTTAPASATNPQNPVEISKNIFETIGERPTGATGAKDPSWDYFPFHDRDFTSPAEILLVPGCPPGLFTKQFAEIPYDPNTTTGATGTPLSSANTGSGNTAPTASVLFANGHPHAFPYLPDKFFYTAASVSPDIRQSTTTDPTNPTYPNQVGGWTGTGWHKMFDFFEVPSSANGATGSAANGENFDWSRADRKPGLVNLNLIVDEEVFFGVLDDPRMNIALGHYLNSTWVLPSIVSQVDANGYPARTYSISDPSPALHTITHLSPGLSIPTITNTSGLAPTQFRLGNPPFTDLKAVGRGFLYGDPVLSGNGANQNTIHGMKGAFADFLMLRHGGSPYLFGHGSGQVQDGVATHPILPINSIPADIPYHSLSFPDINYTIMRPAYLPPSAITTNTPNPFNAANPYEYQSGSISALPADPGAGFYVLDSGVRFPYLDLNFNVSATTGSMPTVRWVPPIPPRRFFQIPDNYNGLNVAPNGNASNASLSGDNMINIVNPDAYLAFQNATSGLIPGGNSMFRFDPAFMPGPSPPNPPPTPYLAALQYVAAPFPVNQQALGQPGVQPFQTQNYFLGGKPASGGPNPAYDNRQHPAYRTELLQKVMNLTTVRTHQFAVWITVGFFEISKLGTPELGLPDVLGGELGLAAGNNVRYRSFFVIDRTLATGFNPYYPGEFRNCVTYRRRIE